MELIAQGAEAKIYREGNKIIKERILKSYRLKEIDEQLRKSRTKREIKIMKKLENLIPIPKIYQTFEKCNKIVMEFIEGKKLAESLDKFSNKKRIEICKLIGTQVAILHNNNVIHGDLTTSNMILKENKLYFIDFGLSFVDIKVEHKAVDLHLLNQALESKHYKHYNSSFKAVLEGYKQCKDYESVMKRLENVEKRGHYKNKKNKNS